MNAPEQKKLQGRTYSFRVSRKLGSLIEPSFLHLDLQRVLRMTSHIQLQRSICILLSRVLSGGQVLIHQHSVIALSSFSLLEHSHGKFPSGSTAVLLSTVLWSKSMSTYSLCGANKRPSPEFCSYTAQFRSALDIFYVRQRALNRANGTLKIIAHIERWPGTVTDHPAETTAVPQSPFLAPEENSRELQLP